jgi:hypothetical protein
MESVTECAKCGSPLQEGQDWCLQCGTGKPGSLSGGPGWRTGAAILGATALLVGGASVAAYAALKETKPKSKLAVLATRGPAGTVPPASTPAVPGATTPGTPTPSPGTPTTVKAAPPKIPLQTPTPKSSGGASGPNNEANNALFPPETKTTKTTTTKTGTGTKTTGESTKGTGEGSGPEGSSETKSTGAEQPSTILLDTNAASTYNPYSYPPTLFGDPSLAIDGEAKTAWSAQVQAVDAPKMAEGLVLDLKSPQKLASVTVKTSSTGTTVEVYGANGHTLPASISDPEWKRLVGLKILKKKTSSLTLKTNGKGYRFVVLWLAKAPASSTAANPGSVSIDELELFPAP